jgi:hypothetical protein
LNGDAMEEFLTAYRSIIELYTLCYNDLLKTGMNPVDATRNAESIMRLVLNINNSKYKENNEND